MINQRAYPDILLGFSKSLTIASHGCYSMAILQGLLERGYQFSVAQWNELLKSSGVYTEQNPTLIAASTVQAKLSSIFEYGGNEAWSDSNLVKYLSDKRYIVIGEVSAKGIGGSGQHFVKIDRVDVKPDGKISMTYIDDPWGGLEDQKVTTRYNTYGNILSLRVFKIKAGSNGGNMANMYKGYDLANPDSMKVAVDEMLKKINGVYVAKTDMDKALADQKTQLTAEKDKALEEQRKQQNLDLKQMADISYKSGFDEGYIKGKAEAPVVTPPVSNTTIPEGFEINGVQTQEEINGVLVTKNYARKE